MKVYSPSQTKTFLECPVAWKLSRMGVTRRQYNKGTVYAIRGSAVSAGLECYNNQGSDVGNVIAKAVYADWEHYQLDYREWAEFRSVALTKDEVVEQATALVKAYTETHQPFEVLHAEFAFKDHGNARADVIGKIGSQILPVDYKCKDIPASDYYRHIARQDYRYDWQLMHYCWAVGEVFNIECLTFGIVVLWYAKKPEIEYIPFIVQPDRLALWLESARDVWSRMEACENGAPVYEVASHRTPYGQCEYYKACLEYQRDFSLMSKDYLVVTRKPQ